MESNAGKMQGGNNLATSNSTPPSKSDNGPIGNTEVSGGGAQGSMEISDRGPEEYATQNRKTLPSGGRPSPRNHMVYPSNQAPTRKSSKTQGPSLEPPVTKGTLSELDVNKIVNNPKLRHDINFDPDLHFRPNLDGEKGRKKTQRANYFWETMTNQLQKYLMNREGFEKELGDTEWCLPATLRAIRGILETLVPQRDRLSVEETFNVDLLMQQFRKGVADMVKLANWLSQLLKCHCAPMRDDWVDEMVTQLSNGDRNSDVALLTLGMKNLLGVLEAMKLDVANHQIRCLRPLLIEDTVHFEQKFFMKKIAMGRVDIAGAHAWFKRACCGPEGSHSSQGNTLGFIKALVNLILPSKSLDMVPHTFLFDEDRLIKLRADMLDLVNLEVCMHLYRHLETEARLRETRYTARNDTPVTSPAPSPYDRPTSPEDNSMLSSPTLPLPHHFAAAAPRRIVSATSSLRSSLSSMASTPQTGAPTPFYLSQPHCDSSSQVRMSLQAILSSSTSSEKWTLLSSALALQILRSTTTPLTRLPQFESDLARQLADTNSRTYQEAKTRVLDQLIPVLEKTVKTYTSLTSLQIFETAAAPRVVPGNSGALSGLKEEISEITTRIAHIGILHWRVWSPLAYLVDPDTVEEREVPIERARSTP